MIDRAEDVFKVEDNRILELVELARKEKERHWGKTFEFCSIINAKSGLCDRECAFCAQAFPKKTNAPIYPIVSPEKMLEGALNAKRIKAKKYSIVTSGKALKEKEFKKVIEGIELIKREVDIEIDVSLGIIPEEFLVELKKHGIKRIHHNMETSKEFYPQVTRKIDWMEKFNFVKKVKELGFELCCGGLFGMGETTEDIISLANALLEVNPDSIPINFLIPIKGTPFGNLKVPNPVKLLKIAIYFRFKFPKSEIRLCGGREENLRDLLGLSAFFTNGFMVGGYLTRAGRDPELDLKLIEDLGLTLITE